METHAQLEAAKAVKMASQYKVTAGLDTGTKDVDTTKRIVQSIPNTYLFFDSDQDVLLPNCASKTIKERGPMAQTDAKIKNVKAHVIDDRIGKPQILDEREMGGRQIMYGESKMLNTTLGNDTLIEYQEGVIDQHSIGFRYIGLDLVTADDEAWKVWISKIINPKDAEAAGYMFLVKEIEMFEWSPVSFGANRLSAYLGVKSDNVVGMQMKLFSRLDLLQKQLYAGKQSDFAMFDYELETRQIKQIISELFTEEPSIKATLVQQRRLQEDTQKKDTSLTICSNCLKSFNYNTVPEQGMGYVKCPSCGQFVDQKGNFTVASFDADKFRSMLHETKFLHL